MKVSISELRTLPQQRLFFSFKESLEGLDAVKPVLGELTASANAAGIYLKGSVQTLLKLTCHRCLRPYFLNLHIPIEERFIETSPSVQQSPKERELTAKDFVEYLSCDGTLDISDVVYQAVTLATPVTCLCGDNCPGPAFPAPGKNSEILTTDKNPQEQQDRIDPRWKNLKSLLPKKETD